MVARLAPKAARLESSQNIRYECYGKHKQNPRAFGVEPVRADDPDATLCDADANFLPADVGTIPGLVRRGFEAGLIGEGDYFWSVADNGWVYEARVTNAGSKPLVYHGYPLLTSDSMVDLVLRRFQKWAKTQTDPTCMQAAQACQRRYGIKNVV